LISLNRSSSLAVVDSLRLGVVSLTDGTITDLGLVGTNPHYVGTGHVVFGRAGGLVFAAPFSLRSRSVTGPAVLLAENVWQGTGGATGFAVSDNGTLVYHTGNLLSSGVSELVVVDRTGLERRVPGGSLSASHSRVSPDGKRIAVTLSAVGAQLGGSVALIDVATGARQRTTDDNSGAQAEWTRDGARLLFLRPVGAVRELVSRAWDRSGADLVLARDSTRLLFEIAPGPVRGLAAFRGGTLSRRDLYLARMDSLGALRALVDTPADERAPGISADGRLLAYTSNESGTDEIYVQPIPGPGPRLQVSVSGGTEPLWSRTGATLFYRTASRIMTADVGGVPMQVTRRDSLFTDAFRRNANGREWDVFPGGREFLMLRSPRATEVSRVHVVLNWPRMKSLQRGAGAPER